MRLRLWRLKAWSPQDVSWNTACEIVDDLGIEVFEWKRRLPAAGRLAGQDASIERGFYLFARKTCERHPVMLILTFHGSFLLCHCVMVMRVTIL